MRLNLPYDVPHLMCVVEFESRRKRRRLQSGLAVTQKKDN